jgi:hypothetical protein
MKLTFYFKRNIVRPVASQAESQPAEDLLRGRGAVARPRPSAGGPRLASAPLDPPAATAPAWTRRRFFEALTRLGRLRVISISGASTFEAICDLPGFQFAEAHMNAIHDAYHWHLDLRRFGHVRSRNEVHVRSGRRVLYFELRADTRSAPFLRIYLYRALNEEFGAEREQRFAALHAELGEGVSFGAIETER